MTIETDPQGHDARGRKPPVCILRARQFRDSLRGPKPQHAVVISQRGLHFAGCQTISSRIPADAAGNRIQAVHSMTRAQIDVARQILCDRLDLIAGKSLERAVHNESGPIRFRIVDARNAALSRTDPQPASLVLVNPPNATGRDPISRAENAELPPRVPHDAEPMQTDPDLPSPVLEETVRPHVFQAG